MLKIACSLTGDNFLLLSSDTPASKKKVVALSIAMLVPTFIWIFNGFMLSYEVLKSSIAWSILIAALCGIIVFLIEKLIVMANGNGWLVFFRICIGLIVAILGSLAIDEVIFKNDIDISVARLKENTITATKVEEEKTFNNINNIFKIEDEINSAQIKFDDAEAQAIAEADGTKGTGSKGVGQVAKFKNQKAEQRKQVLNMLYLKKETLTKAKDSIMNLAVLRASRNFNENGLLIRIKALFDLVVKDGFMLTAYILFTLLMFFFEFLVVILKQTWTKTNYERKLEMIEAIGKRRMEFLQKPESTMLDPGNYLRELKQTKLLLNKKTSIYN